MIMPTMEWHQAAEQVWDVIVVGAGPAGALAARELARRDMAVLLVDRASFPRFKVCGCCLNLRALNALAAAGLGALTNRLGAVPLKHVRLAAGRRQAELSLPGGAALSRGAFDAALVQAAIQAGAAFLPATQALLADCLAEGRGVILRQQHQATMAIARLVLAADGLGGRLLARETEGQEAPDSRVGAGVIAEAVPAFYERGTIFMACGTGGYVGLVRLEDGRLDLAAAFAPGLVKQFGSLGKAAARIVAEAGLPTVAGLAGLPWRGTPRLTRHVSRPAGDRTLALGDAAGYVEPFTGEGMAWALAAGIAVAPLAVQACRHWRRERTVEWSVRYHRIVARRQRTCRIVAGVLRRPALTRLVVAALAQVPALAAPLIHYLNLSSSGVK